MFTLDFTKEGDDDALRWHFKRLKLTALHSIDLSRWLKKQENPAISTTKQEKQLFVDDLRDERVELN